MSALWKGAVPTAMGMAAENAMAFGVNEALKRAFPDPGAATNTTGVANIAKICALVIVPLASPTVSELITGLVSVLLVSISVPSKVERVPVMGRVTSVVAVVVRVVA